MITPSMLEDFREWRGRAKPEDLPALEEFIKALTESVLRGKP